MQIRIRDGKVGATLSKREHDALETSLIVLQFLARNDLFSVKVYSSVMEELLARGVCKPESMSAEVKQGTLKLDEPEEVDGEVAKA